VDYIILDEWYKWIVENHPCKVDQIGWFFGLISALSYAVVVTVVASRGCAENPSLVQIQI